MLLEGCTSSRALCTEQFTAVPLSLNLQKEGPSQDSNMKALGAVETENVCFSNQGEHNSM
jgi:hypothetical protein